ncbi:MAG: efflux RND transporter periplasmic adaptor subunit [Chthonomonadales bacterium]|nr:efflux RND transporter periplasmic adaptor subunit [Chthonomonadales bacterium]
MTRILAIAVAVVVLAAGGFFLSKRLRASDALQKPQYKLAVVELGMVKKTVSATGVIMPWTTVDIKSKAGGRVDEMPVEVGDVVHKGQLLARIDPTDTLLNVNQARADVESASAREAQSDRAWRLQVQQTKIAIANADAQQRAAQASLDAAEARLKTAASAAKTQPELTTAAVGQATANLASARQQLEQLKATQPQDRAASRAAYDQAMANSRNAQANLTRQTNLLTKGFVSQQAVDAAQASADVVASQVRSAKEKLDTIDEQQRAETAAAQARVTQADAQLRSARAQGVEVQNKQNALAEARAAVKQARAQLAQANASQRQATANKQNDAIKAFDIATARASIQRARASLQNAETTYQQTEVTAPSEGVVLQKYVEQGTIISSALSFAATGNNIIQLGDVTRMYVDVAVDETDIANVSQGQPVDVTVEAYPGIPFEGKVTRIDPQAKVDQNVTQIHVRVELDNTAPAFRLMKPMMNATCEFVVDRKEDVVAVPSEAVRTDDNGQYVEVARNPGHPAPPDPKTGEPAEEGFVVDVRLEHRPVEVGVEGNESTEITSGLKAGEQVVVQTITPEPDRGGSPFASGRFGGRRR